MCPLGLVGSGHCHFDKTISSIGMDSGAGLQHAWVSLGHKQLEVVSRDYPSRRLTVEKATVWETRSANRDIMAWKRVFLFLCQETLEPNLSSGWFQTWVHTQILFALGYPEPVLSLPVAPPSPPKFPQIWDNKKILILLLNLNSKSR